MCHHKLRCGVKKYSANTIACLYVASQIGLRQDWPLLLKTEHLISLCGKSGHPDLIYLHKHMGSHLYRDVA